MHSSCLDPSKHAKLTPVCIRRHPRLKPETPKNHSLVTTHTRLRCRCRHPHYRSTLRRRWVPRQESQLH